MAATPTSTTTTGARVTGQHVDRGAAGEEVGHHLAGDLLGPRRDALGSVGSANFAGDAALLDGSDSSEFLSTTLGGTVNGLFGLNTAAGADLELGEATLFRSSGTNETFTMNNPGAGDLNLFVGGQITASGYINFPTVSGSEPPSTDCDDAGEAGRAVVRTDGTTNLYICRGATGWIGK